MKNRHGIIPLIVLLLAGCWKLGAQPVPLQEDSLSLAAMLNVRINSASKHWQTTSESPASITIISSDMIRKFGYRTLADVLNAVRGFYTSYDRNYAYVGIRGFGRPTDYSNRVKLLLNGMSVNECVFGSAPYGTDLALDLSTVERIEVVRGPNSTLYGTGSMLATINVVTKSGEAHDGMTISGEVGSFRRLAGSIQYGKNFSNGLDIAITGIVGDIAGQDLYFKEYDAPESNNGMAVGMDWDRFIGFSAQASFGGFSFQGLFSERSKGIPTGSYGTIFSSDRTQTKDRVGLLEARYDHEITEKLSLSARAYFNHYYGSGNYPYEGFEEFDSSEGNFTGAELRTQWDILNNNRLVAGLEYCNYSKAQYRVTTGGVTSFETNNPFNLYSIFIQDEWQALENVSIIAGVRRDEYSSVGSATSPRFAIVADLFQGSVFKILYGQGFRAPNIYETWYADTVMKFLSNPNIKPERISTYELVWEQRFQDWMYATVSLFQYDLRDLIDQVQFDDKTQFQNISAARTRGVELDINVQPFAGVFAYANYAWQRAVERQSDSLLTNAPEHLLKAGVAIPIFDILTAALEGRFESGRKTVYGTRTKDFIIANLTLSTQPIFDVLRLSLSVRNLFNTAYQYPGGLEHNQDAFLQDGRNILVRATCRF